MKDRPDQLNGRTFRVHTGHGYLYVIMGENTDGKLKEVICQIGKSGQSVLAKAELTGRMITLALEYDVPISEIIHQLKNISGENPIMHGNRLIKSIPDAVSYVLEKFYMEKKP